MQSLPENSRNNFVSLISLICLFLFAYTTYSKLQDHQRFLHGLTKVAAISSFAEFISWAVPIAEFVTVVLLILPKTQKWGLYCFTCLMAMFTVYIISMKLWAAKLPCHCGGAIERLSWTQHIWFNLVFIVLAVFAIWLKRSNKQ